MSVEALQKIEEWLKETEKKLDKDVNDMRFIIDSVGKELHSRMDKIDDRITKNEEKVIEKLAGKVGWKQFYIMVGFLVSLFVGISTLLYTAQKEIVTTMYTLFQRQDDKIDRVRDTVGSTQQDVSVMKGWLKNADISN